VLLRWPVYNADLDLNLVMVVLIVEYDFVADDG
jgi:hypothetical protein